MLRLKKQIVVLDVSYRMALWGKHVIRHSATEPLILFVALLVNKGLYLVEIVINMKVDICFRTQALLTASLKKFEHCA